MKILKKLMMTAALLAGTSFFPALYAEKETTSYVQKEKVDWLEGKNILPPAGTDQEKEAALARFKKSSFWKILPKDLQEAIENNKENYQIKEHYQCFIQKKNIIVDYGKFHHYEIKPNLWQHIVFLDAPLKTPAVDPKTNKYYVMPPKKAFAALSASDLDYIKKLTEQVNRNIHYLGNSPIPKIDVKRMQKGAYLFTALQPLRLVQVSKIMANPRFKKIFKKTEEDVRSFLELEDEVAFQIADRLGTPVYHPEQFCPEEELRLADDCYGIISFAAYPLISPPPFYLEIPAIWMNRT